MAKLENRYANALLELTEERGNWEEVLQQAELVRDILDEADIQAFLVHPHIQNSMKQELLQKSLPVQLSDHLMGFLFLMIQKSRESVIVPALTEFIVHANRRMGRIEAKVVSAQALEERQLESIRMILAKQFQMEIVIHATVDSDVIGGFYVLVEGRIFDGTVRHELNMMKERLKRGGYIDASST